MERPSPIVNVKFLGIHIDNKLTFEPHVRSLWKKASQKLNAFARIACSLTFDQRKVLNTFITSQFSYAPVVCMFYNRKLNNHINRIHERALRIVHQDHNSTFEELLAKDGFFKIHDRNLQRFLIEIFKVKKKLATEITNEVFDIIESPYLLRNELWYKSRNILTVRYGIETVAFNKTSCFSSARGSGAIEYNSRLWSYMPSELNESTCFFIRKFLYENEPQKPKNLKKMLRKSPATDA